jgi:hypothetical protein
MSEHISEQDLLMAIDGELTSDRQDAVTAHAAVCAACEETRTRLEQLSHDVAALHRPAVAFRPEESAVAGLLSRIAAAGAPRKTHWTSRPLVYANTLVALAAAITCILLLPSLHVGNTSHASHPAHAAAVYDLDQPMPPGYVSLPYGDPSLPLDDAEVLPVDLSADDLELMGVDAGDEPVDGVKAEILIGMDGWPRAIRIVEQY